MVVGIDANFHDKSFWKPSNRNHKVFSIIFNETLVSCDKVLYSINQISILNLSLLLNFLRSIFFYYYCYYFCIKSQSVITITSYFCILTKTLFWLKVLNESLWKTGEILQSIKILYIIFLFCLKTIKIVTERNAICLSQNRVKRHKIK